MKKEKGEAKTKRVYGNLGAMFAVDPTGDSASSSSNDSDENFTSQQKMTKNNRQIILCKDAMANNNI